MALGLCLLWGYCGVLSFGQVAYFGIAGYLYGIIAGNMRGDPWGPLLGEVGGLVACAVVSAIFGYFMFYARVQRWIVPILTLVLALLLETFLGQTAGYQWRVGSVQLGGYNGMTGIPWFQLGDLTFFGYSFYYYVVLVVLVSYLGCRALVNSHHGKVMLAMRETRCEPNSWATTYGRANSWSLSLPAYSPGCRASSMSSGETTSHLPRSDWCRRRCR